MQGVRHSVILAPWKRFVALAMTILLLLPSPSLMAITMGQIKAGVAGGSAGGGQGSAPNLVNAGAASAALTAALTKKSQQQSAAVVAAMQKLQAQAAAAAKVNPITILPNGQTVNGDTAVYNGLKAGWLEPYVGKNSDGSLQSGFDANGNPITTTWKGAAFATPSDTAKAANPNYVNIKQTAQNAFLYWNKFNVGPATTVNFDQSAGGQNAGNWIAFNKVMSASDPSHIFGNITAQGQVYVLNQNGILFHNGSTVNTHALVAATLPINENLAGDALDKVTGRGIANNPDSQFLFSSLVVPKTKNGTTPTFDPSLTSFGGSPTPGDVVVEKGASIVSPVNDAGVGGLVALIGPNVRNEGSISTPAGQTVLAAGLQVALTPHPSKDPSLRGMDVIVGQVSDPNGGVVPLAGSAGSVINDGIISVPVGNATLAGKSLSLGEGAVIDSTTTVALNGRIDLLASYGATLNEKYTPPDSITGALLNGPALLPGSTGGIELGEGSVIRILPQKTFNPDGTEKTVVGSSLPLNSIVDMIGNTVHFAKGSILEAPGAAVTAGALTEYDSTGLLSGVSIGAGNWFIPSPDNPKPSFVLDAGQIYLDQESMIDVSGSTGVQVDSSQNYVTLQLRGPELANSPLQRGNLAVRGKDITVDVRNSGTYNGIYWIGTPLGDATGYAGLIQRGVGQLTEAGGSVSLSSGDSVVMQSGSSINVSGGWTQYSGGNFSTTKLITSDGRIVDISKATPDQVYAGIVKDPPSVYEPAYTQGAAGGSLSIQAPSVALTGNLYGLSVAGQRQVVGPSGTSQLPSRASLNLNLSGQRIQNSQILPTSPYAPSVTFDAVLPASSIPDFSLNPDGTAPALPATWSASVSLPSSLLTDGGFGSLSVSSHDGVITIPKGINLSPGAGGSISLEAASVEVAGSITAPGGKISLTADLVPYSLIPWVPPASLAPVLGLMTIDSTGEKVLQYGPYDPAGTQVLHADGSVTTEIATRVDAATGDHGLFRLDNGAVLNVAGSVVNEFNGASGDFPETVLNGGAISIAAHSSELSQGAQLDVSGGGLISPTGKASYGKAGKLSIATGTDPQSTSVQSALPLSDIHDGSLQLAATLRGYSGVGQSGGSLSITAESVQVGGTAPEGNVLWINPTFFNQGGFSTFSLKGIGNDVPGTSDYLPGIMISPGTRIHPVVASQIFSGSGGSRDLVPFAPASTLKTAASLSFTASGVSDSGLPPGQQVISSGDLFVGSGALIQVDPQLIVSGTTVAASAGAVSLSGKTITLLGSIVAPGGSISVLAGSSFPSNDDNPPQAPQVTAYLGPDVRLSTAGNVLLTRDPSGLASRFGVVQGGGSIALVGNLFLDGSTLDASGASGVLDLRANQLGQPGGGIYPTRIDGAGGTISLTGKNALYTSALLSARSGGATAPGGSLTISSGSPANGSLLELTQFGGTPTVSSSSAAPDSVQSAWQAIKDGLHISTLVGAEFGTTPYMNSINAQGGGFLAVSTFSSGGFGKLNLQGNVTLDDSVTLSAPTSLSIASGGILTSYASGAASDSRTISLSSAYVVMGQPFLGPLAPGTVDQTQFLPPSFGAGMLDISAKFVDLGNLSLQQIGKVVVDATGGAIRGDGTFDIAGDLNIKASVIYPAKASIFTINAYNFDPNPGDAAYGVATGAGPSPGSVQGGRVTINRVGSSAAPISAGGSLVINADTIVQGGYLSAPFGSITLGSASGGGVDPLAGTTVSLPATTSLEATAGSIVSVSGKDPVSGIALTVPFGYSPDGSVWIDPSGTDISTTGLPSKGLTLSAQNLQLDNGSLIDASGGGEMTATHWISGLGGTLNYVGVPMNHGSGGTSWIPYRLYNSTFNYVAGDLVTDSQGRVWSARQPSSGVSPTSGLYWNQLPQSYAVIPGYHGAADPSMASAGSMPPGMTITIGDGSSLKAGTYTLLPASYASLPGAYLLSALPSQSTAAGVQPDGSARVYGSINDSFDASVTPSPLASVYEIDSPSVFASKVSAPLLHADAFFPSSVGFTKNADGGKVSILGSSSLQLQGSLHGAAASGGKGAVIDINSGNDFSITQDGTGGIPSDTVLSANILNSWNYGSLVIGGTRGAVTDGKTPLAVSAANITLADGTTLSGNDIILAANNAVTLGQNVILDAGTASTAPNQALSVAGDGAILRVSSDSTVSVVQSQTDQNAIGGLVIGANSQLLGQGVVLSTSLGGLIDPSVTISSKSTTLTAGRIDLDFTSSVTDSTGIVLGGNVLNAIFSSRSVSLNSLSTINLSGAGSLGGSSLASLVLHSGGIFGDGTSGNSIQAGTLLIDNPTGIVDPSTSHPFVATGGGAQLTLSGSVVTLGAGAVAIGGFQSAEIDASGGFVGSGKGTLNAGGDLTIKTPLITGAGGADTILNVPSGTLTTTSAGSSALTSGLADTLSLNASTISLGAPIVLNGGSLSVNQTGAGQALSISSTIDVSGKTRQFFDKTESVDGGSISLSSAADVNLVQGATLKLDAAASGTAGSAGTLSISAPNGSFSVDPSAVISAMAAPDGTGASFSLDVNSLPSVSALESVLVSSGLNHANGFNDSQSFRIRSGNVAIDSSVKTHAFSLSADTGFINVTGSIDASGKTGGSISLQAGGSVILEDGSALSVHGDTYDAAGKGGSILLSAGSAVNGQINPDAVLDLRSGSTIDLGVTALPTRLDQFGGTLHLRAPINSDGTDIAIHEIASTITGASSIAVEGYRFYDLNSAAGDIASVIDQARGDAQTFFGSPGANSDTANQILARLGSGIADPNRALINLAPGVEIINQVGDLTLSQDWDLSQFRTGANSAPGFLTLRASGNIVLNGSLSDGFTSSADTASLLSHNTALPANFQSWSYQLTAGADFGSANLKAVTPDSAGSVQLGATGFDYGSLPTGQSALILNSIVQNGKSYFQVIRTGTGDISINAAGDFQLRTPFASVYTSGTPVLDQNLGGTTDTPVPYFAPGGLNTLSLGTPQQVATDGSGNVLYLTDVSGNQVLDQNGNPIPLMDSYLAQFSYAGGNISIHVGGSISRVYGDSGQPDSQRELPSNWLYRQGQVDPATGKFSIQQSQQYVTDSNPSSPTFGQVLLDPNGIPVVTPSSSILSTAWWVDFSNFFEGVGALGGGNITMKAGKDVSNVDAVIPTQARADGSTLVDPAGKTIQSLADESGQSVANLLLINASQIAASQPAAGTQFSDAYGNSYTVQSGDTLQSIAANWDTLSGAPTPTGMTLASLMAGNASQLASLVPSGALRVPATASSANLVETGGGDLSVISGHNINAGVYYVERGQGTLQAGGSITTDSTRDPFLPPLANGGTVASDPNAFLPTSLFLGKGGFNVSARGDVLLGPTGNVFLMPQSINNGLNTSYFSTYDAADVVRVASLTGSVTLRQASGAYGQGGTVSLMQLWMSGDVTPIGSSIAIAGSQPWLRLNLNDISTFGAQMALQPGTLDVVSFGGGITFQGNYTASPSATGEISLLAAQSITGLAPNGVLPGAGNPWSAATINLSDADPATLPSALSPINDYQVVGATKSPFNAAVFAESGSTSGSYAVLQTKQQLHDSTLLHLLDAQPVTIYSTSGDVADFTLFSPKKTQVFAGGNIADVGLYIQNLTSSDTSIVSASGDISLYNNQTPFQKQARAAGAGLTDPQRYNLSILQSGDLQVSGPGVMEVLAGENIDLGNGANNSDGTGVGITSIGNARNPALPFQGADLMVSAGVDLPTGLSSKGGLGLDAFATQILKGSLGGTYLSELSVSMTYSGDPLPPNLSVADFAPDAGVLSDEERAKLELQLFYLVLRDAGRAYSDPNSPSYRSYLPGEQAIATFFGKKSASASDITLWSRDIRTKGGGNISMIAPNGGISLSSYSSGSALTPPGIVTEHGGGIDIYTKNDVSIGIGRIFTLRGGDIMIWSDKGNIAAGSSAKTVATAPPTRVLIDPTSGNVQTDLAGLATGGGIGVLDTVAGIPPGNVDLIAVSGIIDAGDAGIRSSGTLHLAATKILNADNIVASVTTGAPPATASAAPAPAAAPAAAPPSAASAAAANNSAAETASKNSASSAEQDQAPSIFSIDILGYGGGGDEDDQDKKSADATVAPIQASL